MRILVSNDDGVFAPGLECLVHTLSTIGEVKVIAPDRNRSGASNSLTLSNPLRCNKLSNGFISVAGTPTDCVHLGLTGLFPDWMPDIVVSGINDGSNLSDDILYSGTVAAAVEGRHLGLSAVAVSLCTPRDATAIAHYATAAHIAKQLVIKLQSDPSLPNQTILNVNVPNILLNELKGCEVTHLGSRYLAEPTIKEKDPRGRPIYWIGPPGNEDNAGPNTDFYAIKRGYASITPLKVDFTNYTIIDRLSKWIVDL